MCDIQEANWWKPELGEPYRPLVAMPAQLRQRVPWLSFCEDIVFTAYDPPTALRSATALVPIVTPGGDPKTHALAAVPSPTVDPGDRKTVADIKSTPAPIIAPAAQKTSSSGTHSDPEDPSSDPKQGGEMTKASDPSGDPGKQGNLNAPGLPLQPTHASSSGYETNQNIDSSGHSEANQSDREDPAGRGSGQESAGASRAANSEFITPTGQQANLKGLGLPLLPTPIVHSSQGSNLNVDPADKEPNQSHDEDPTEKESRQKSASTSQITNPEAPVKSVTSNESNQSYDEDPIGKENEQQAADASQVANVEGMTPTDASQPPQRIITTIAGHAITAAPAAVAIAGTTVDRGDPGVTIGGTLVALNKAGRLVLGSKTIPLASGIPRPITTTIAGQAITADPTAIAMKGSTMRPGDPVLTVDGTLVALDTAGRLLVGTRTIPFETESAKPLVTTIAGQGITVATNVIAVAGTTLKAGGAGFPINGTMLSLDTAGHFVVGSKTYALKSESVSVGDVIVGASGVGGSMATTAPSGNQSSHSVAKGNATSTSVQMFTGEAEGLKSELLWMKGVVVMMAMSIQILI